MELNIEPELLKSIVKLDREQELSFMLEEKGIVFRCVDSAHVGMFSVTVLKETLGSYKIDEGEAETIINIKKELLQQILSITSPSDNIFIKKEDSNTLRFEFGLIERKIKTITDTSWQKRPKMTVPESMFTIKTENLRKIFKASSAVSDAVMFVASEKGVSIGNKSAEQSSKIAITRDLLTKITFTEQTAAEYPLDYLNFFSSNIPTETVDIHFGTNFPIFIYFSLPSNTKVNPEVEVIIAPRINKE